MLASSAGSKSAASVCRELFDFPDHPLLLLQGQSPGQEGQCALGGRCVSRGGFGISRRAVSPALTLPCSMIGATTAVSFAELVPANSCTKAALLFLIMHGLCAQLFFIAWRHACGAGLQLRSWACGLQGGRVPRAEALR